MRFNDGRSRDGPAALDEITTLDRTLTKRAAQTSWPTSTG
jgi:hypothetical protein